MAVGGREESNATATVHLRSTVPKWFTIWILKPCNSRMVSGGREENKHRPHFLYPQRPS